jgi:hypothetical protein
LKRSSSTIRELTWPCKKDCQSILLTRSRDEIYWRELFHDKRRNYTLYETLSSDYIVMESWWYLLKGSLPR